MKLDLIFSVGPACRPAYHLKTNFLRTFACPLDWQMNYSLDTCLHLFQTKFQTFFSEIQENTQKKGAHNNRRIIDTLNSITSIHYFDSDIPLPEAQTEFRITMQKRYLQLHTAILKAQTVGLICNRTASVDALSAFLSSFSQLYPHIEFILINIKNEDHAKCISMQECSLTPKLIIREYSFCDKYVNKHIKENSWIGNTEAWDYILQDFYVTQHPFADWIKNAISDHKLLHLFGAGVYCHKIIHFLKKYELKVSSILVSSLENNPENIEDVPVISYENISKWYFNDLIVISVVNRNDSLEIYNLLKKQGFNFVIRIDSSLRIIS